MGIACGLRKYNQQYHGKHYEKARKTEILGDKRYSIADYNSMITMHDHISELVITIIWLLIKNGKGNFALRTGLVMMRVIMFLDIP